VFFNLLVKANETFVDQTWVGVVVFDEFIKVAELESAADLNPQIFPKTSRII